MSDADAPPAAEPDAEQASLGREVSERQRPLRSRRAALADSGAMSSGPGLLARRSVEFSLGAGLSLSSRHALGLVVPDLAVAGLPVIPPAELDESIFEMPAPRTGNATLDHIILTQRRQASAAQPPRPRRGLRAATARRNTPAGRHTAPGASAQRMRPQVAPMSRDLEIQRLVSGDGPDTRPRAPRSGPQPASSAGSGPSASRPGRDARGRLGRPAPWHEPSAQLASVTAPAAPVAPADHVAAVAAGTELAAGLDRGSSGLQLPQLRRSLPPGIQAPRSGAFPPSVADGPSARIAAMAAASPTGVESLPVGGALVAGMGPRDDVAPGTTSASGAAFAPGARASSTPTRSRRPPTVSGGAIELRPPGAERPVEPALAALLRAAPPGLALVSPPRRSVATDGFGRQVAPTSGRSPVSGSPRPSPIADLPVAFGGLVELGTSNATGSIPSVLRGLGTVAAAATPVSSRSLSSAGSPSGRVAGARVAASSSRRTSTGSTPTGTTPTERGAPRAIRTLPDLGVLAPAMMASMSVPASGASVATRGIGGAPDGRSRPPVSLSRPDAIVGSAAPPSLAPTSDLPVSPPAIVPSDPGEQFNRVLDQHRTPRARPLPRRFEPIARSIVPRPDRVRVSTDLASRAALEAVGKVAATAGDIVHLARPLDASSAMIDILAHELTHVAHPSPAVRFYDDHRDSKEERLASEMGSIMAKAPVGTPPVSPPPSTGRSGGSTGQGGGGQGGVAIGSHRQGSTGIGAMLQGPIGPVAPPITDHMAGMLGSNASPPSARVGNSIASQGTEASSDFPAALSAVDVERLLDALEARVIRELERRGRRWPRPI
jgi:hypothetical protein